MFTNTGSPGRSARRSFAGTALAAALLLSACATPTPYQPLTRGAQASGGYSEQRIEDNRFRVMFRGNSLTSREQVENYLLFRAAELTLQLGYDGFTMVSRATDPRTRTSVSSYGPYGPGPWGYWGPSWRYYGGYGWRHWDPWGPDPFWADSVDVRTVTSFEASAEVVMFRGRRAADPQSFDARQVIANLGPRISYPRDR